ncbi:hypothetical protein BaRGS_00026495 [Batillaria attramentaria]|uniref:Uncharacterized protein n=1 Tax=Batillaria attramentaria TaxID=370345 RepID=A0ABD0K608_9CAEN
MHAGPCRDETGATTFVFRDVRVRAVYSDGRGSANSKPQVPGPKPLIVTGYQVKTQPPQTHRVATSKSPHPKELRQLKGGVPTVGSRVCRGGCGSEDSANCLGPWKAKEIQLPRWHLTRKERPHSQASLLRRRLPERRRSDLVSFSPITVTASCRPGMARKW